jgi:hypothetical protein
MDEVRQEVVRRDPDGIKTLVALTDGERALQIRVSQSMKVTLILDLIHVLERVWRAAHVFQPEGTTEAEVYAKLMALRILQGDVARHAGNCGAYLLKSSRAFAKPSPNAG